MYKQQGTLQFSPSDLTTYMASPFASWMNRYVIENLAALKSGEIQKDAADALMGSLQQRGYAHGNALEAQLQAQGKTLAKIASGNTSEQYQAILSAMHGCIEVIVQARLSDQSYAGFDDF